MQIFAKMPACLTIIWPDLLKYIQVNKLIFLAQTSSDLWGAKIASLQTNSGQTVSLIFSINMEKEKEINFEIWKFLSLKCV